MPDNQPGALNQQQPPSNQPGQKPTFNWDALVDPSNGKIMGKYENAEEFRKGFFELTNYASQAHQRAQAAEDLVKSLGDRLNPATQAQNRNPDEEQLETLGIPMPALEAIIDRRAQRKAEEIADAKWKPMLNTMNARSSMAQENPDYLTEEGKVMQFLAQSPTLQAEVSEMAQANPRAALKYAYVMYKSAQPRLPGGPGQEANRTAAGLPPAGGGGAGDRTPIAGNDDALNEALKHSLATKDPRAFFDKWLEGVPLTWAEQQMAAFKNSK